MHVFAAIVSDAVLAVPFRYNYSDRSYVHTSILTNIFGRKRIECKSSLSRYRVHTHPHTSKTWFSRKQDKEGDKFQAKFVATKQRVKICFNSFSKHFETVTGWFFKFKSCFIYLGLNCMLRSDPVYNFKLLNAFI